MLHKCGQEGLALPLPWPPTHTFIPALHGNQGGKAGNSQIHKATKKITYKTGPAKIIITTINK